MADHKNCETCGDSFNRKSKDSQRQWDDRAYCSMPCANKGKSDVPPHLSFWQHVGVNDGDQCWDWHGVKDQHGYGRVHYRTSKIKAHRVSYEMRYGPIPEGLVICHECDNPNCVNPKHLFADTQSGNMKDASSKGRLNPKSLENLRPGMAGVHGAGPKSNGELSNGR